MRKPVHGVMPTLKMQIRLHIHSLIITIAFGYFSKTVHVCYINFFFQDLIFFNHSLSQATFIVFSDQNPNRFSGQMANYVFIEIIESCFHRIQRISDCRKEYCTLDLD